MFGQYWKIDVRPLLKNWCLVSIEKLKIPRMNVEKLEWPGAMQSNVETQEWNVDSFFNNLSRTTGAAHLHGKYWNNGRTSQLNSQHYSFNAVAAESSAESLILNLFAQLKSNP